MGLTRITAQQISNIDYKQAVRVVTLTNITLAGSAPNTVDGVTLVANDRILVAGQSTGSQNGLYYVSTLGTGSNGTWTRTTDADNTGEILAGMIVMVTEGTAYADTQWKLTTNDPITIGSTALTFVQNYLANSISSGTSNVTVGSNANVTISSNGTANVLTISSTGTVVSGTESVTGNITGGNILTGGIISSTGNVTGNYILGNGASLTGVITSVANINSGTSNVTVVSSGGNVTVGVGGTSNIVVWATTGEYVTGVVSASGNITGGNILTGGLISATGNITGGNILFGSGVVSGTGNVNGNVGAFTTLNATTVSASGNITGGNVLTGGLVSVTGNITGGNILSNSRLSVVGNIVQSTSNSYIAHSYGQSLAAAGTVQANAYSITATNNQFSTVASGAGAILPGGLPGQIVFVANDSANTLLVYPPTGGSIDQAVANAAISLSAGGMWMGTALASNVWTTISPDTLGTTNQIVVTQGNGVVTLALASSPSVSGTVTAASVVGGVMTGTSTSVSGTVTAASVVGGVMTGTSASVNGNVTGGNIVTGGTISSTGNVYTGTAFDQVQLAGGYTGAVSALSIGGVGAGARFAISYDRSTGVTSFLGNTVGSPTTTATISAAGAWAITGNITGGNVLTAGIVSATGNVTGGNLITAGIASVANNLVITSPSPQAEGGQLVLAWANISGISGQANSTWNMDVDGSAAFRIFYQNASGAASVMLSASPTSNVVSFPSTAGISAAGNITGSYFVGNGSALTGIIASAGASITNGNSNVSVAANSNVTIGVAGTGGVATFATTGIYVPGLASVTGNVNIGNAAGVTFANAGGVRAWSYYNNATTSIDTVFL